jgi:hypothetical protein
MATKPKTHGGARPGSGRPPSPPRKDQNVRIDRDIAAKAQYLAKLKGVTLATFLSDSLRGTIDAQFSQVAN